MDAWWWEPLEVSRKLVLTGVVLLIPEETILLRTIIALLVSLFALVATGAAQQHVQGSNFWWQWGHGVFHVAYPSGPP